ncbi:flagellin [Metarhizobium album]|uniref:Flagellin n=1 Tax=Metarhizobium album TaxID=2182425 RepID=A0A2U2DLH8_9HYPH|nr:flagellin [Rhizobium album]PWE54149.1 flagellin [Rhizobium album]
MSSILTNWTALAALDTLRSIGSQLGTTQSRISSGYRVENASDNAAYWSIATTMRSDNKALSAVEDAIGLGSAKVDTTYAGMNAAIEVVDEIKAKLVAAREPGVDKLKVGLEIEELKNQIHSIAQSSSFSGENWLYTNVSGGLTTKELVTSFVRSANGTVSIGTTNFDAHNAALISDESDFNGILTMRVSVNQPNAVGTGTTPMEYFLIRSKAGSAGNETKLTATTSNEAVEGMIMAVDKYLDTMADVAATLGSVKSRLDMQKEFVADLSDVTETGIGRLVDADMNEESTRLKALQTQQQLGSQALSIANSSADNILSLFR